MGVSTVKKPKESTSIKDTTNPFNKGVSYSEFLDNVKGNVTIDSLLKKAKCSKEEVKWIKLELNNYKNNK